MAETRGNPLTLLELPRGLTPAELAGGFGLPGAAPLTGRIEDSFDRQLAALPEQTRQLLQLAAADPSGDQLLKSGGPPGSWASSRRRRRRRWRQDWPSSAAGSGSGTRWRARLPTDQPRSPTGSGCTRRWPR